MKEKHIKPGTKVGLKLTAAERKLILDALRCLDQEYEQVVRDTPSGKPIQLTLDDWDDFGGFLAAEANHTPDKKLQKKLEGIFQKIQGVLDTYTDEEPELKVFEPGDDDAAGDLGSVDWVLGLAAKLQASREKTTGQAQTYPLELTKPEKELLLEHTRLPKSLQERFSAAADGPQTFDLGLLELMEAAFALSRVLKSKGGREQETLLSIAAKVTAGLTTVLKAFDSKDRPKKKTAKPRAATSKGAVYQLKISINGIEPPVWRRIQTKDCSLDRLHELIQLTMGWEFSHLYAFEVGREHYSLEPDLGDKHSQRAKLSRLFAQGRRQFTYVYDFGDNWEHLVEIEQELPAERNVRYPRCIEGARACPPEDSGGAWEYAHFLEVIRNPKHEEHDDILEWVGGSFDPEAFDLNEVNEALKETGR